MNHFIKKLGILFIIFYVTLSYSQARYCREIINPNLQLSNATTFNLPSIQPNPNSTNSPDSDAYPDAFPNRKYVYKLHFNIIRDNNGVRVYGNVGEAEVMNIVRDLNLNFNQFNIFFKYVGFDYANNTNFIGDFFVNNLNSTFGSITDSQTFNINILDGKVLDYDQYNNIVSIPGVGFFYGTTVFLSYNAVNLTRVASHEIGHCFNLYHDFRGYDDTNIYNRENVIRATSQINNGYNANFYGDKIHDTPATKIWEDENQYNALGIYIGNDIDSNTALQPTDINRFFKTEYPKKNNIMHVHDGPDYTIGYVFTPGQGKRMRWTIATDIQGEYGAYYLAETAWEELYQPFETKLIGGDVIISVTENPDDTGSAIVCRNLLHIDRFQKGFTMKFTDIDGPEIAGSSPDDLMEMDRTGSYFTTVTEYQPDLKQMVVVDCTRGVVCEEEPYIGGIVFSTQVLGSMNITVKELNEIEAKDPDLFNKLLQQYYHILKKTTSSGAVMEKFFYKE